MEKQKKTALLWAACMLGTIAIFSLAFGFVFGVEHQAKQEFKIRQNYKPLYTSRIVVKCADMQVIAFTSADCDSTRAKDSGWWFNKLLQDTSSTIVVENIEWPYNDECIK